MADELRGIIGSRFLVLDGATGTELARRGVAMPAPLWSAAALIENPDVVEGIHRDYVAAGADIIVADTFRTNPRTLERAGRLADGPRLIKLAVELARRAARSAAGRRVWVAASVAPVEDCYGPELVPDESTLEREHGLMVDWLTDAGPDLIWIETINTVREAQVASRAAARAMANRGIPFAVSFVPAESGALLSGEPLADAVAAVEPFMPLAIGLNCIPPKGLSRLLPMLRALTRRPIAAYGHIGNVRPIRGWTFASSATPEEYATMARAWFDAGAAIVGGCCGTTPEHIRAVASARESLQAR